MKLKIQGLENTGIFPYTNYGSISLQLFLKSTQGI